MADLQQYYGLSAFGLGLDGDADGEGPAYAAILASQLPASSRTARRADPDAAWGPEAQLLRLVELDVRLLAHALAGGKGGQPEPVELPSEAARRGDLLASAARSEAEVFEALKGAFPGMPGRSG